MDDNETPQYGENSNTPDSTTSAFPNSSVTAAATSASLTMNSDTPEGDETTDNVSTTANSRTSIGANNAQGKSSCSSITGPRDITLNRRGSVVGGKTSMRPMSAGARSVDSKTSNASTAGVSKTSVASNRSNTSAAGSASNTSAASSGGILLTPGISNTSALSAPNIKAPQNSAVSVISNQSAARSSSFSNASVASDRSKKSSKISIASNKSSTASVSSSTSSKSNSSFVMDNNNSTGQVEDSTSIPVAKDSVDYNNTPLSLVDYNDTPAVSSKPAIAVTANSITSVASEGSKADVASNSKDRMIRPRSSFLRRESYVRKGSVSFSESPIRRGSKDDKLNAPSQRRSTRTNSIVSPRAVARRPTIQRHNDKITKVAGKVRDRSKSWCVGMANSQVTMIKQLFKLLSKSASSIDAESLHSCLKAVYLTISLDDVKVILKNVPVDNNGEVELHEFLIGLSDAGYQISLPSPSSQGKEATQKEKSKMIKTLFSGGRNQFGIKHYKNDIERHYERKQKKAPHVLQMYTKAAKLTGLTERQLQRHHDNLYKASNFDFLPYRQKPMFCFNAPEKVKRKNSVMFRSSQHKVVLKDFQKHEHKDVTKRRKSTSRPQSSPASTSYARMEKQKKARAKPRPATALGIQDEKAACPTKKHRIDRRRTPLPNFSKVPYIKKKDNITYPQAIELRRMITETMDKYYANLKKTLINNAFTQWASLHADKIKSNTLRDSFRKAYLAYAPQYASDVFIHQPFDPAPYKTIHINSANCKMTGTLTARPWAYVDKSHTWNNCYAPVNRSPVTKSRAPPVSARASVSAPVGISHYSPRTGSASSPRPQTPNAYTYYEYSIS